MAMRFKFKFATVLEVRKNKEREALRGFSDKQFKYKIELDKKEILRSQLQISLGRREDLSNQTVAIEQYLTEQDFIMGTKHRLVQADQAISRAKRDLEKFQQVYLFCRKQTRMIEVLFEQAQAQFKKNALKRENRELDDFMIMRARLGQGAR